MENPFKKGIKEEVNVKEVTAAAKAAFKEANGRKAVKIGRAHV
mgnify:CR=1 FL=1